MKNFVVKSILYYALSTIFALAACGAFDVLVYWALNTVGLSELGKMTAFQLGLGITQTSLCIFAISDLAEEILYSEDDVFNI